MIVPWDTMPYDNHMSMTLSNEILDLDQAAQQAASRWPMARDKQFNQSWSLGQKLAGTSQVLNVDDSRLVAHIIGAAVSRSLYIVTHS